MNEHETVTYVISSLEALSLLERVRRSRSGNRCSWCLKEYGVAPEPDESHGVCDEHRDEPFGDTAKMCGGGVTVRVEER